MDKERKPGYYWLKIYDHVDFEIGEWNGASWSIFDNRDLWYDSDFAEIDEQPIIRTSK